MNKLLRKLYGTQVNLVSGIEKERKRKGRDVTRSASVKENTINDFWQLRRL